MRAAYFYAVELATERGYVLSRTFRTLYAARRWARLWANDCAMRIVKCSSGQSAEVVQ
jgi:hypothetical protein